MYTIPAVMLALTVALPAAAAEKLDAEARARAIAPFVDEQTVGVVHIDLTRIDAEALLNWVAEVGRLEAKEIEEPRRELRGWLADFTKAGGKELYFVVSLADLPRDPLLLIVPLAAGADAQVVRGVLGRVKAFESLHFETFGQALLGGSESALKRLRGAKPAARPELAKAFAAAGDTTAQVLLLPTPDMRRVVDELLPMLPPQAGGGSSRPLTHGLLWAAVGIDLPPKLSLRLVMQSPDAESAAKLKDLLVQILKSLAQQREVRDFFPDIGRLVEQVAPRVEGDRLTHSLGDKELKAFLPTPVRRAYQAVQRRVVVNKLKQLGIVMFNYLDAHKNRLPATASLDKQGKPLLSWRVHLLPFLGEQKLYQQFHLDEPWDSPHNKKLLANMPEVFHGPNRKLNAEGKTLYLLPVGKHAAFKEGPEGPRFPADFADGTSNTILIVEADDAHAVPWTKPQDLTIDPEHPQRGLGGHFHGVFVAALADGSVHLISEAISKTTLQRAFNPADGQPMGPDW
ncbi:MAG TPA: DUF1559 domain-containing protein [Gemmataceae bacterium]|nr:DUF1559 domain-containing protein [Gemmataceae bacterium]